jgi:hypothetical protein
MPTWQLHGHAIVSADHCIADRKGRMPDALRNDADWALFQAELDRAVITLLGRLGHEVHPNPRGRRRLVVSSQVRNLEMRSDGWWWNPAGLPLRDALAEAAPEGGIVAVPGGRLVFDLALALGFDGFHLTRSHRVTLPDGIPVFSQVGPDTTPEALLARHGLRPGPERVVDAEADVTSVFWSRG